MAYHHLRWPLLLSLAAAVVTIGMKATAYAVTGSVGLFSDALESGINLIAAVVATFSLWYANRPSDPDHQYGHEKIEFFSSGVEGALVFAAGGGSIYYAVHRLLDPKTPDDLGIGTLLAVAASAVNFAVGLVLLRVGRRHGSIILEADGHHLMTDVLTTAGVLAGLGLGWLTGLWWFDPLAALVVGVQIGFTGFRLVRRSFDGLMDRALPADDLSRIRAAITAELPPGTTFHHLRTRQAGRRKFVDFHLLVDGGQSVRDGHTLAHRVEEGLLRAVPGLEVTIHIEPIDERASWEEAALKRLGEEHTPAPVLPTPPIDD
ncbi:MAG: cation diffusion facilitator family transporter [Fimbriiglobus sp.]|jgi:cation diffusion facilitator family transporter|nr:cation diffusion facilitator family transporter [Fimbriiglobus sp.]